MTVVAPDFALSRNDCSYVTCAPTRDRMIPPGLLSFEPRAENYVERVRASFSRQGAMRTIGAELLEVRPGYCSIALPVKPALLQQHGYVHAGMISTIVDTAGGYAGFSLFPENAAVLTVEFKVNLLAPAAGERLIAEGFVVKPGRTLAITRGEVHAERGGERTLVAIMQQTLMVMHGKADG